MSRAMFAGLALALLLAGPAVHAQPPAPDEGTRAEEDFELDIQEKRITEEDFHASTAVELGSGEGRGLEIWIGTAVAARQIDVLLRGVHGRVRFFATLDPVLQSIESHRAPAR
jgi:hypothetical protein